MKKTILLLIPALMVLSACQPLSSYAAAGTKVNQFAEDTLAHDEVFGKAEAGLRKVLPFRANGANAANPAIAVQYMDESEGYRSLRFVAAVKIKDGDLANTQAVWTRTMYKDDGSVKKVEDDFESVKAYTTVNDGGYALDIKDFSGYIKVGQGVPALRIGCDGVVRVGGRRVAAGGDGGQRRARLGEEAVRGVGTGRVLIASVGRG